MVMCLDRHLYLVLDTSARFHYRPVFGVGPACRVVKELPERPVSSSPSPSDRQGRSVCNLQRVMKAGKDARCLYLIVTFTCNSCYILVLVPWPCSANNRVNAVPCHAIDATSVKLRRRVMIQAHVLLCGKAGCHFVSFQNKPLNLQMLFTSYHFRIGEQTYITGSR